MNYDIIIAIKYLLKGLEMKKPFLLLIVLLMSASASFAADCDTWKDQILYFVLLDRFHNGNVENDDEVRPGDLYAFHGGDVAGLMQKLDYLEKLGITGIWLSPTVRNRPMKFYKHSSYHGYWPWDFWSPDPRFATEEELVDLAKTLKKKDMKLLLDLVVNHMGYDAPFAAENPEWFNQNGNIKDWNNEFELVNHNIFGLPDFASQKPVVKKFFKVVGRHWLKKLAPDGFRLDAVKHVPIDFWKDFNAEMRLAGGADFMLLGEYLNGDPQALLKIMQSGKFTSLFDFPLYYTIKEVLAGRQDCRKLASRLYFDRNCPDASLLATFIDNHDLDRFMSLCEENVGRHQMALAFILTARGIPTLYYGDEQAMSGHEGPKPYNRADMVFDEESETFKYTSRLIGLRKQLISLRRGLQCHLHADESSLAFARLTPDELAVAVFNNSDQGRQIVFPFPFPLKKKYVMTDLIGSARALVRQGQFDVFLPPRTAALFVPETSPEFYQNSFRHWQRRFENEKAWGVRPVKVKLKFDYAPEKAQLLLTGNCDELGNWNPDAGAVPMVRVADDEFVAEVSLPIGKIVECKCLYRQIQPDETVKTVWQNEDNCIFTVQADGTEYVHITWRTLDKVSSKK